MFATLGCIAAHASRHRGSILLTLKRCGHGLAEGPSDRIWDWDRV